jgi:hypothetical protein
VNLCKMGQLSKTGDYTHYDTSTPSRRVSE